VSHSEQELSDRLDQVSRMPYGRGQVAAVEELLRHVDAAGSDRLKYVTRLLATTAYQYGGEPAKAFVTFSWCLAAYDRGEGDPAQDHHLFWYFKWMVNSLTKFPEVPLDRTYRVLDDMERRYRLAGHSMNPVHQYRAWVAQHIGDRETAAEQYRLWCATPRGAMADCVGCEPSSKVSYLAWQGRHEEAVALAVPVLAGQLTCVEQPQGILTGLLESYLRTGRLTEAAEAHRTAYRAIQGNRADLHEAADHISFCTRTGNHARALELVERHLGWLAEPPTPMADMWFSAAAAGALARIVDAGHSDLTVRRGSDEVGVAELRDELTERTLALSARFDARNGTGEVGRLAAEMLAAEPLADHLPLSGPARKAAARPAPEPVKIELPDSPEELAELAARQWSRADIAESFATWARFDEVCPEPEGTLLVRRLNGLATWQAGTGQPELAEQTWLRAAEVSAEAGDEPRRQATLGHLAMLYLLNDRADEGYPLLVETCAELDRIGTVDQRLAAQLRLVAGLAELDRNEEANAVLAGLDPLVAESELPDAAAHVALIRAQNSGSAEDADRAVELWRAAGPCNALCRTVTIAAHARVLAGDLDSAYRLMGEALTATDPILRGQVAHQRGRMAMELNRPQDAYDSLVDAIAALTTAEHGVGVAYAQVDLAAACLGLDRPDELADCVEDALPVLVKIGDVDETARARFLLAKAYRALGRGVPALELLDQVAEHCRAGGNPAGVAQMLSIGGEILDSLDRDAEAAQRFAEAADAYHESELPVEELSCRRRCATSWLWDGEHDLAIEALAAADVLAAQLGETEPALVWEQAMLGYDGARVLANTERFGEALVRVAPVAERFRRLEAYTEAAMAEALRGRLLVDLDRIPEADQVLSEALAALPEELQGPREQLAALLERIRS
jgi:tetratricopeptide (TPR) repeat protein